MIDEFGALMAASRKRAVRTLHPMCLAIGLAGALLLAATSAAHAETISNGQAAQLVLDELVLRIERALPQSGGGRAVGLRGRFDTPFTSDFENVLAPRLEARGFEVWILEPEEAPTEGQLLFDYEVSEASIEYVRERSTFLGLGTPEVERRVTLSIAGTLADPTQGHVLWQGGPKVSRTDGFPSSRAADMEADNPEWVTGALNVGSVKKDESSGLLEKAAILGLMGGVVILYAVGAR